MCVSVFFSCYLYVVEWQHFYRLTKQIAKRQLELGETALSLEIIIFDEWLNTNRDIETEVNEWHCIICSLQLYNTYATCLMTLNNVWMTLAHLISIHFILVHIFMRTIFFLSLVGFHEMLSFILCFRSYVIDDNQQAVAEKNESDSRIWSRFLSPPTRSPSFHSLFTLSLPMKSE